MNEGWLRLSAEHFLVQNFLEINDILIASVWQGRHRCGDLAYSSRTYIRSLPATR